MLHQRKLTLRKAWQHLGYLGALYDFFEESGKPAQSTG